MARYVPAHCPSSGLAGRHDQRAAGRAAGSVSAIQLSDADWSVGVCAMRAISFLRQFVEIAVAIAIAPLFTGWIAQCRAWLQNRTASSLWQPYRMLRKLFQKDVALANDASPLFRATPYVLFGTMVLAAAIIPSLVTDLPFARIADSIALIGLFATARVFLSLAAMDVGTAFGTLGARREMMIGFLAEPALLMVLFNAFLLFGS